MSDNNPGPTNTDNPADDIASLSDHDRGSLSDYGEDDTSSPELARQYLAFVDMNGIVDTHVSDPAGGSDSDSTSPSLVFENTKYESEFLGDANVEKCVFICGQSQADSSSIKGTTEDISKGTSSTTDSPGENDNQHKLDVTDLVKLNVEIPRCCEYDAQALSSYKEALRVQQMSRRFRNSMSLSCVLSAIIISAPVKTMVTEDPSQKEDFRSFIESLIRSLNNFFKREEDYSFAGLRGCRLKLSEFGPIESLLAADSPKFNRLAESIQVLRDYQLVCEVAINTDEEMRVVLALVERCTTDFVIEHCGRPDVKTRNAGRPEWHTLMPLLGKHRHCHVKLGGLGSLSDTDRGWSAAELSFYYQSCLFHFGPDRCFFASDWPNAAAVQPIEGGSDPSVATVGPKGSSRVKKTEEPTAEVSGSPIVGPEGTSDNVNQNLVVPKDCVDKSTLPEPNMLRPFRRYVFVLVEAILASYRDDDKGLGGRPSSRQSSWTLGFPARWQNQETKKLDLRIMLTLDNVFKKNAERKYII